MMRFDLHTYSTCVYPLGECRQSDKAFSLVT
jgi:hypothetical protein